MRWLSSITTFEFNLIPGYLLTLTAFRIFLTYLNAELDFAFSSAKTVNFELNFGPVLISSGLNHSSEQNFGITIRQEKGSNDETGPNDS